MEKHPSLHLGVAAIEKGAFGSSLTKVAKFTLLYFSEEGFEEMCKMFAEG